MGTHAEDGERLSAEAEAKISHFIPSVELKGSRVEQIEKLDILIAYLEQLRGSLAGNVTMRRGSRQRPRRYLDSPVRRRFAGGVLVATPLVLMLVARSCA